MKKIYGIVTAGLLLVFSVSVGAQEMKVSVDGALDFYSQYVWRGLTLANKPSLQPGATLGFGDSGVAFNVWGSMAVQERTTLEASDELDFTLSVDRSLGAEGIVGLSLGYIQYTFPNAASGSRHSEEFYAGLSVDNPAAPSLTLFYDFGLLDAWYITAGIAPEFPLDQEGKAALGLSADVDLSDYSGSFGFHAFRASASVSFSQGAFSIAPVIGFSYGDDGVITTADNQEFWGGLSVSFSK